MAGLKRSYLFHGDDEVKIDQARTRLAARAQKDGSTFESISGDALTAENFAMTLTSPSLLPGTRIVLADGIEAWKAADVGPAADAVELLAGGEIDAVAVLVCRKKPLKAILDAIETTGGEIHEYKTPSDAELPRWLISQAKPLGVELDPDAAELLVAIVGKPPKKVTRAQDWSPKRRLLSELQKLATTAGPGGTIDTALVADGVRGVATSEIFDLTDHAVSGNTNAAIRDAEKLLAAGEPPARIVAMLARSFGQVQTVAALIEAGRAGEITENTGIQPWIAKKLTAQARQRGGASLRDALVELARLDDAVKGGTALDNETELLRSIQTITA
ncbi:MAG: DNA polymerase III subunit delta [Thermoleophilaceae bacterium]|nr:DNA polymerase III subunit delta [Thermoleophilaceae bacterium]